MKKIIVSVISIIFLCGCASHSKYADLQTALNEFVQGKDANIGIAVIIDGKDTVAVNGNQEFPMLSVYKLPIALALADEYRNKNLSFGHSIAVLPGDLHIDTYSPMTEKILASSQASTDTLRLPARELLCYMLQQSDNNASDIVLSAVGGVDVVRNYLNKMGANGIHVCHSENEMHIDNSLCYANSSTPIAMASLIDKFDREFGDSLSVEIKRLMETCATGTGRLVKPLMATNAAVGHKTGTGFTLPNGRLMAINDVGYIHLPNKHNCAVAVFIENSGYNMEQTEALIAEVSRLIYVNINISNKKKSQ